MNNSSIKSAKTKLANHKEAGKQSKLSIYEVAHLMDTVNNNAGVAASIKKPIFFSALWN